MLFVCAHKLNRYRSPNLPLPQAAYMIAHPLSYNRASRLSHLVMFLATLLACTILLPANICHFFWVQPHTVYRAIEETYGADVAADAWPGMEDNPFVYDEKYLNCFRLFMFNTLDFNLIANWYTAVNLLAVVTVVFSYLMIFLVIRRSRRAFGAEVHGGQASKGPRSQNMKIVRAAMILSCFILLPWLPQGVVLAWLFKFRHARVWLEVNLGPELFWDMVDGTDFLLYMIPWVFPLLNLLTNPVLIKARRALFKG